MPQTAVYFYRDAEDDSPVLDWFSELRRSNRKAFAHCLAKLRLLQATGHALRRPAADYLRDGIYELRAKQGTVQYRAGHFDDCVKWCAESLATMRGSFRTPIATAEFFVATGHHQLGKADKAREAFERARLIMETEVPKAGSDDICIGNLEDWLIAQVAYREAAALLGGGPATSQPTTAPAAC